jgi:glycerol-3-phosphate acyltransferase PlsY
MDYAILILILSLLIIVFLATRSLIASALIMFSFLSILLPIRFGIEVIILVLSFAFFLAFLFTLIYSIRSGFFDFIAGRDIKKWRIFARPFALLFIPIDLYIGHRFLIILLGYLALIIIGLDLYRIISKKQLSYIFKQKEARHFSSMTGFLVSVFIVFLLFPANIAYFCLVFILFGDLLSKIIGIKYGRTHLIHERTLEGSLGFLAGCLYAGTILYVIFSLNLIWLIVGSIVATLTELFSWKIDDNFSVGIITGCVLICLKLFFSI